MNLYKLSQDINNGNNTFDCIIVSARNHKEAREVMPKFMLSMTEHPCKLEHWAPPEYVNVEYVGKAKVGTPSGKVICASFNAG